MPAVVKGHIYSILISLSLTTAKDATNFVRSSLRYVFVHIVHSSIV
jgi:hypothetical protein